MYELNDDMDELFRRAAKDYPLDTNTADWNKLQEAMQKADATSSLDNLSTSGKKSKRRFLWLLLLLLPLSWVEYEYSRSSKGDKAALTQTEKANISPTSSEDAARTPTIEKQVVAESVIKEDKSSEQHIKSQAPLAQVSRPVPKSYLVNNNSKSSNKKTRDWSPAPASAPTETKITENNQAIAKDNDNGQPLKTESLPSSEPRPPTTTKEEKTEATETTIQKKEAQKENKQEPVPTKKTPQKGSQIKGFYIGIAGGPDLSNVKLQTIKNVGFNGGIIIGYQWNKRFSVESGLAWDKKYYYSAGEYFSTKNIYLPANTKIETVDGNCNMIELPVNLRYNFKIKDASTWSALAGFSSYFMKKENYDYEYYYTNGQTTNRSRSYDNSSNHWFSVINLGAAYSHKLGRTGNFRIEPYIKLPVKGLGIGRLPIMSTGINVGFTKKIF